MDIGNGSDFGLIEPLSKLIYSEMNKSAVRTSFQQARYGDRLYGYQDVILNASGKCLRTYMGEIYCFDGMVWRVVPDIVLESAIGKAMVRAGVPKSDVVNSSRKLVYYAKGGASASPLNPSGSIIGFRNGVWDFTDVFHPIYHSFDERMPILSVLPYDYDPSAGCEKWNAFLSSILPKGEILKLQKYLGLGCADRKTMTHKVEETLWLVGSGANGKSTIFDVVRAVYGADNLSYVSLGTLLNGSPENRARFVGSIVGKIFNYCSEIQADDISRYSDTFKALCSGEPQAVRRLGHNPETAYDIPFLIFNMNQRPVNRRMDQAILRRLIFIPFKTTISAADMNRELSSELMKELPGIRNWMLEGLKKFIKDDYQFSFTKGSDDEMTDYMLENGQTVQVFLQKRGFSCNRRTGHWEDKPQWVTANALYEDYVAFCQQWLQEPMNQRAFGGEMSRLGWHETGGGRKRTSVGYAYAIFCDEKIDYKEENIRI